MSLPPSEAFKVQHNFRRQVCASLSRGFARVGEPPRGAFQAHPQSQDFDDMADDYWFWQWWADAGYPCDDDGYPITPGVMIEELVGKKSKT